MQFDFGRPIWPMVALTIAAALPLGGCGRSADRPAPLPETWPEVLEAAAGKTVRMSMWDGDPLINAYMRDYVAPRLREEHQIELQVIGFRGNRLVSKLMVELEAGRQRGDIDLMWINGETFYQLRQLEALVGPWTDRLPAAAAIDWDDPLIAKDFQQPIEGYECPWGRVQQVIIYHPKRVANPPQNTKELAAWINQHPGRFTIDSSFTGMTFLKALLYEFAGTGWDGSIDSPQYARANAQLWEYLEALRPNLWKGGEAFPADVAQLHQLFAGQEIDFTFSNNDGEVDNKVLQGILPEQARGYVWQTGTIANSHYLGIPVNAPEPAAAMVLANLLASPAAQLEKSKPSVWGDGTVLDIERLPGPWPERFRNLEGRSRVPAREVIAARALPEPEARVMMRLFDDFQAFMRHGSPGATDRSP